MIRCCIGLLLALSLLTGGCAVAHEEHDAQDAVRLMKALDAVPGDVLADVGAGSDAPLTLLIAPKIAPGRIYATEIGRQMVADLRRTVEQSGLGNVVVVRGRPSTTHLPRGCCDGIFLRDVYHHFEDPKAMNASLYASLKPSGRMAILDFSPEEGEAVAPEDRDGEQHGVNADTMLKELQDAGFERVALEPLAERGYLVVVRKPAAVR